MNKRELITFTKIKIKQIKQKVKSSLEQHRTQRFISPLAEKTAVNFLKKTVM